MKWSIRRSCIHPDEIEGEFTGTPDLVEDHMQRLATEEGYGELSYKYFRRGGCWEIHSFFVGRDRKRRVFMKLTEVKDASAA